MFLFNFRDLRSRTSVIENRITQLENQLSSTKSSNSPADETVISEIMNARQDHEI